ncbi:MAG: DUF2637 domain-containing protein [Trebonia sp.]|uniref:DUF2637 domain-containing protein n=1 Tax=Trebonia sp. TaxID=2767075 RepID=UPI003BB0A60D
MCSIWPACLVTAGAVIEIAAVAAVASYELARAHGAAGWSARLLPLTVDGLIYASCS